MADFVQVPPDSTGKRILTKEHIINGVPYEVQAVHLVCGDDFLDMQTVDHRGAAYVRFNRESLDPFGRVRISQPAFLAAYGFEYEDELERFYVNTVGSGSTASYNATEGVLDLDVGTASGAKTTILSNKSFPATPGWALLFEIAVAGGDEGKTNNARRWGAFTSEDGVFFQQDGEGEAFSLVFRSSATGSVVDTLIPQAAWNADTADGNGTSGFHLDPSNLNSYWIQIRFTGCGSIRCGTYDQHGERLLLHELNLDNTRIIPMFRMPTLPIGFEIENTGLSASPSRLKVAAASVCSNGQAGDTLLYRTNRATLNLGVGTMVAVTGAETYICSLRAGKLFEARTNRMLTVVLDHSILVEGAPIFLRIRKNATLTSTNFTAPTDESPTEVDTVGDFSGGDEMWSAFYVQGASSGSFDSVFGIAAETINTRADGDYGDTYTITAQAVKAADSSSVALSIVWADIGC